MFYTDVVIGLSFVIDLLLLVGANRLCGFPSRLWRVLLASFVGAGYAGLCCMPQMYFAGRSVYRMLMLAVMGLIAYGFGGSAFRGVTVFVVLSMALDGIVMGMNRGGAISVLASAVGLCVLCAVGLNGSIGTKKYIPVELHHEGKSVRLTALVDTGNTLKDPLTGGSVLVVGAQMGERLLGLSAQQLRSPIETVADAPIRGLRLIPYTTVGQPVGFLLAVRIQNAMIGRWRGSALVAFAPEKLEADGYQALTGGIL